MLYDRLDRLVLRAQERLGRAFWPALALALMAAAAVAVRPRLRTTGLGVYYAELARHPFAFDRPSPVRFRLLTPALSWLVGLRGDLIIVTNWVLAAVFLGVVGSHLARRGVRPADGPLGAAIFAFSLVTLSTVFAPAYCDPMTYLLTLGMWMLRARPLPFYALFFANLLNRESIAFLVPWFAAVQLLESPRPARTLAGQALGYGLALGALLALRAWISAHAPVRFDLAYYLEPMRGDPLHHLRLTLGRQWLAFFTVFKVMWVVPLAAGLSLWRRGQRARAASLALLLACTWSQLLFAYDASRLFTLAFPAMVVGLEQLYASGDLRVREWLPWLLLVNLGVPSLRVVKLQIGVMDSLPGSLLAELLRR